MAGVDGACGPGYRGRQQHGGARRVHDAVPVRVAPSDNEHDTDHSETQAREDEAQARQLAAALLRVGEPTPGRSISNLL